MSQNGLEIAMIEAAPQDNFYGAVYGALWRRKGVRHSRNRLKVNSVAQQGLLARPSVAHLWRSIGEFTCRRER